MKTNKVSKLGVIGIDEVGRGPLAGPVTVCAVYLAYPEKAKQEYFDNTVRDSKRLSSDRRIKIYQTIRKNRMNNMIAYAVSSRSAQHVDRHGINNSIHECMISCLSKLESAGVLVNEVDINLDGGLFIRNKALKQQSYVKGDENFVEIALASIIAKVSRDKFMKRVAKNLPGYGFTSNVGYGTTEHITAIKELGITKYHRTSYLSRILSIRKNLE